MLEPVVLESRHNMVSVVLTLADRALKDYVDGFNISEDWEFISEAHGPLRRARDSILTIRPFGWDEKESVIICSTLRNDRTWKPSLGIIYSFRIRDLQENYFNPLLPYGLYSDDQFRHRIPRRPKSLKHF